MLIRSAQDLCNPPEIAHAAHCGCTHRTIDCAKASYSKDGRQREEYGLPVTFWVGADQRQEILRQNRIAAEVRSVQSPCIKSGYELGHNHYRVISSLGDPNGAPTEEILR